MKISKRTNTKATRFIAISEEEIFISGEEKFTVYYSENPGRVRGWIAMKTTVCSWV